jgi:hypothetical protein
MDEMNATLRLVTIRRSGRGNRPMSTYADDRRASFKSGIWQLFI